MERNSIILSQSISKWQPHCLSCFLFLRILFLFTFHFLVLISVFYFCFLFLILLLFVVLSFCFLCSRGWILLKHWRHILCTKTFTNSSPTEDTPVIFKHLFLNPSFCDIVRIELMLRVVTTILSLKLAYCLFLYCVLLYCVVLYEGVQLIFVFLFIFD